MKASHEPATGRQSVSEALVRLWREYQTQEVTVTQIWLKKNASCPGSGIDPNALKVDL